MAAPNNANQANFGYPPVPRVPAASNFTITYEPLADGTPGTLRSLDGMRDAVLGNIGPDFSGYRDPQNKQAALAIVGNLRGSDASEVAACYAFTRDQITYIDHPWNMQVIQDAQRTLMLRSGDCVSKSVLLATLLASLGHISRFVAQCPDGVDFSHVYVECELNGRWIALDPTADGRDGRPRGDVGWFQTLPDYGCESTKEIFF